MNSKIFIIFTLILLLIIQTTDCAPKQQPAAVVLTPQNEYETDGNVS